GITYWRRGPTPAAYFTMMPRLGLACPRRGMAAGASIILIDGWNPRTMRKLIIAIDGPSGAGKGTVARAVASQLEYRHVDSGAMYRAVGWKALHAGVSLDDETAVARLATGSR